MYCLAADDYAAFREVDLLPQLGHHVPLAAAGADKFGRDELRADVRFGEFFFVHAASFVGSLPRSKGAVHNAAKAVGKRKLP